MAPHPVIPLAAAPPLRVVHFHRRPMGGQVSIERLFAGIRQAMPPTVTCAVHQCPRFSLGLWGRLVNIWDAARHQDTINHITGDVHYLAFGLSPRRTVLTIHDCASLERLKGWRRAVFKWFWFTAPIRRVAVVTVISEATRRELLRHVRCDPGKVQVVPNCITADFIPSPRAFNTACPEILHLGTAANKNLDRLVEALTGIACRLHVIGRLTPEQTSRLAASGVGYVNTPRATDAELVAAFQRCDLVAFVSTYEGFGLPIVEANATGRPVLTSNLLSMPEVAGNAACLVDPYDVATIRAGILKICQDAEYRDALIRAGYANAPRFSARACAAGYAAVYARLAAGLSPS